MLTPVFSPVPSERQALEPVCITLGDQQTLWALDIRGNLWFRTGIVSKKPQGDDDHWWQVGTQLQGHWPECLPGLGALLPVYRPCLLRKETGKVGLN